MLSSFERMKFFHMSGNDGEEATPVPIPNTEVKLFSADGSWGSPPVRVGHCQARRRLADEAGLFLYFFRNISPVGKQVRRSSKP